MWQLPYLSRMWVNRISRLVTCLLLLLKSNTTRMLVYVTLSGLESMLVLSYSSLIKHILQMDTIKERCFSERDPSSFSSSSKETMNNKYFESLILVSICV